MYLECPWWIWHISALVCTKITHKTAGKPPRQNGWLPFEQNGSTDLHHQPDPRAGHGPNYNHSPGWASAELRLERSGSPARQPRLGITPRHCSATRIDMVNCGSSTLWPGRAESPVSLQGSSITRRPALSKSDCTLLRARSKACMTKSMHKSRQPKSDWPKPLTFSVPYSFHRK
jgi:hypothetical protein